MCHALNAAVMGRLYVLNVVEPDGNTDLFGGRTAYCQAGCTDLARFVKEAALYLVNCVEEVDGSVCSQLSVQRLYFSFLTSLFPLYSSS